MALTDDLVKAGRKAGDLVSRIAAVGGGKGGGRPHFRLGEPGRRVAARRRTRSGRLHCSGLVGGIVSLRSWLDARTSNAPAPLRERVLEHALAAPATGSQAEHLGITAQELLSKG